MNKKVYTVIGAGMGGTLASILLAKRGYKVELFESRDDIRSTPPNSDRSINQSLSIRGISILKKAGIWNELEKLTLKEKGRTVHTAEGEWFFSPYGRNENEIQYSFNRNTFNSKLLDLVEKEKNVSIYFNMRCIAVDRINKSVSFKNTKNNKTIIRKVEVLIDSSGINSVSREEFEKNNITTTVRKNLDWGYKSLYVSSDNKVIKSLNTETFHIWPRENCSLFAIPNIDGSFVFTIILPNELFGKLIKVEDILNFFSSNFTDIAGLAPVFIDQFKNNKQGRFECLYTTKWHDDFIVLLGDASHAIMPFYSQGASATFEDCQELVESISKSPAELNTAFSNYQKLRKANTDILTDLSHRRFYELKNGFRSARNLAQDKLEIFISKHVSFYAPLYTFIAHTTIPYAKAYKRYLIQRKISKLLGMDLLLIIYTNIQKFKANSLVLKSIKPEYV